MIAVISIGSIIHEYITDPPGITEVISDDGSVEECLTGDLNDVLGVFGAAGAVRTLSGVIKVFGAPANVRGVTAINSGFTKVNITGEATYGQVVSLWEQITGILSQDTQVWCWPVVDAMPIPVFRVEVTRDPTLFDIERINSLAFYPIFPTIEDIATTLGVQWSGQPEFPVEFSSTPVMCYPGWTCFPGDTTYTSQANPLSQRFGCFSATPTSRSGYITYEIKLEDANGLSTPPITFTFRCGDGPPPSKVGTDTYNYAVTGSAGSVGIRREQSLID